MPLEKIKVTLQIHKYTGSGYFFQGGEVSRLNFIGRLFMKDSYQGQISKSNIYQGREAKNVIRDKLVSKYVSNLLLLSETRK